jgi:hypothetical protein
MPFPHFLSPATIRHSVRSGNSVREGTARLSLLRNIGGAIGISITEAPVIRNAQVECSVLSGNVTTPDRAFQGAAAAMAKRC